jgi:hypothetical protein
MREINFRCHRALITPWLVAVCAGGVGPAGHPELPKTVHPVKPRSRMPAGMV